MQHSLAKKDDIVARNLVEGEVACLRPSRARPELYEVVLHIKFDRRRVDLPLGLR